MKPITEYILNIENVLSDEICDKICNNLGTNYFERATTGDNVEDISERNCHYKRLNKEYEETNCLMTYGSYIEYPSLKRGKFSKQIPDNIIEQQTYRKNQWMSSHLRTFRYKLWKKINKEDFINNKTGNFIKAAWDLAFVFPMLEMCGNRAHYINDILYMYNRTNPLNEDKINHGLQLSEEDLIRSRKVYKLL